MIKQVKNYTFDASQRKITFTDESNIELENINPIINVTRGKALFNGINPDLGGRVSTNVLTLDLDTSAMGDSDDLIIYYDDETEPATKGNQDQLITLSSPSTQMIGKGDITVGLTRVKLDCTGIVKRIRIRADIDNTGIVFIGNSDVLSNKTNDVDRIEAGDEIPIENHDCDSAPIYFISDTADLKINVGIYA